MSPRAATPVARARQFVSSLALLLAVQLALGGCASPAPSPQDLDEHARPTEKAAPPLGLGRDPFAGSPGRVTVLIFITTDCPIANGYAPQIQGLITGYADRPVDFCLVHTDPDTTEKRARAHAADYGYGQETAIILDRQHLLVRQAGAMITPEAVVLAADGGLEYRGRINNWYGDIGRKRVHVTRHELRDAVDAVLAGRPPAVTRAEAVGCSIEDIFKR